MVHIRVHFLLIIESKKHILTLLFFLHIMDVLLNEPDFMAFGHICADKRDAISFKADSQCK